MIEENGLERFYELKGDVPVPPIGSRVFKETETEPLLAVVEAAEAQTEKSEITARFSIEGISCIACVWLIEAIFNRQAGAVRARIDARAHVVDLSWLRGDFDLAQFATELQKIGYRLTPFREDCDAPAPTSQITHRLGLCGFFLLNTMLFTLPGYLGMGGDFFLAPLFKMLGALFATLSMIVGGGYFITRAWRSLQSRVLHIDLPIAIGLIAAYTGSMVGVFSGYTRLVYFDFVATFIFLMLAGRWLQEYALEKNRSHLQKQKMGPRDVTLIGGANDGDRIPVTQVEAGMEYSVAPGDINPVAADPLDAEGTLSLEWINGEAEPVIWTEKRPAPAGAINVGFQSLRFRAREAWNDSLLAQLLERPKDDYQDQRLQKVLKYYIAAALAIAALGGMAWLAATGDVLRSVQVLISILVVSCPCATGVALPMCDEFATARLRRLGLFIKSSSIWGRLRQVRAVVFDKTGTLTMDIPRLTNPDSIHGLDPMAARALAHLVEHNVHPVARSLRENLLAVHPSVAREMETPAAKHHTDTGSAVRETIGQGVAWTDPGDNEWTLGKPSWKSSSEDTATATATSVLRQNGLLVAGFEFAEDVRDDALEAFDNLRSQKLDTAILSGDAPIRVNAIATQLGLPASNAKAECTPHAKAEWIETHAPAQALMIGDGANDSLAFDKAICRGTPVVDRSILEASADFFFFGRSLRCLPALFETAHRRRITATTIFLSALVYNIGAISVCLAGLMHPLLAAIIMPLSSIVTLAIAWIGLGRRMQ